jgi:hypothetical protein
MGYSTTIKTIAKQLRASGKTHREISKELAISLGSAYLWTLNIRLTPNQKRAVEQRRNKHKWTAAERKAKGLFLATYRKQSNREALLCEIKSFFNENGRIPLKKEFNSRSAFRTVFGTWNNAIIAAGFKPNPVFFADRVAAKDGHMCDSFTEKIIDDWLYEHKISHKRNFRYPNSKMTADFYLNKKQMFIEFFGLLGANKTYDKNHKLKLELARQHSLSVIPLYQDDVLKRTFPQKLYQLLE